MSGLEKIIDKINADCKAECDSIISNAENKAKKLIDEKVSVANDEAEKIIAKAKEQCALTDEKARNGAELLEKKIKLQVKNEIITEIIENAKTALKGLSDKEYFAIIEELIIANAGKGEGVLKFSSKDLERLPKDFEKTINAKLTDGKTVKVSDMPLDIQGGVVLSYEDIEENCSFDALIETNIDTIRDKLNTEIFA